MFKPILRIKIAPEGLPFQQSGCKNVQSRVKKGERIMAEAVTEEQFARDTLERYAGCEISQFHTNLLLTNFPRYVDYFAKSRGIQVIEGSMFKVAHSPKDDVSILDFKIGSPAA